MYVFAGLRVFGSVVLPFGFRPKFRVCSQTRNKISIMAWMFDARKGLLFQSDDTMTHMVDVLAVFWYNSVRVGVHVYAWLP